MKNILIFIALVGIGIGIWYGGQYPAGPAKSVLQGTEQPDGEMKYVEEGKYYSIEVVYPARTPLWGRWNTSVDSMVRNKIETALLNDITQFKLSISADQISGPEKEMLDMTGRKYLYQITYKPYASAQRKLVSYEFDIYADTGGAHPNSYYQTLVFDMEGGEVKLGDLFDPASDYLQRLSTLALAGIQAQAGQRLGVDPAVPIFADGVAPKEENFSHFILDGDTLVILIPPYQAAAYAVGTFEVRIPLTQLSDILRPEWK
ncbi:MAG TPA: DUF3298 domain-containing protein [Candidatus Paceibacterota bacterium]